MPYNDNDRVGAIFGNVGTTEFKMAVSDPTLRRLDYVKVGHETDGVILAQVMEISRETSMSFDQATKVSYGVDSEVRDHLTASVKVVGYRDSRGLLQSPRTPLKAGQLVLRADDALIARVFGLTGAEGAFLGFIKGYELPVALDINTLVQKHVSILAKTGSGKSYCVGVLMEELIKRGVPIVVIDPHGEHGSLCAPNQAKEDAGLMRRFGVKPRGYAEHIVEYSPDTKVNPDAVPLRLDGTNMDARDLIDTLGSKLSSSQVGMLHAAVRHLADEGKDYTLEDVLRRVKDEQSNTKWNLVTAIEFLMSLGIFAEKGTPVVSLVKRGKVSILNLKGVSPDLQEVIVASIAKKLFEARKAGKVPPFMLVVEEAHNFCPERGIHSALSSDVLRTVASEGRKFGMGLTVVSQRPAKVDKNVLSQCNTQLILKVTNPNDIKAIVGSVEGLTSDTAEEIQRIPVGVAIVSHPRIAMPVLVEIRPRETSHGGASVDVMAAMEEPGHEAVDEEPEEKPATRAEGAEAEAPTPVPVEAPPERVQSTLASHDGDEDEIPFEVAPLPPAAPGPEARRREP
ncbi:MAG TPA: ATP-binding protein, partial [Candidatus Thermoplasmatota archaeon]|nr:ATP-binding protein [Candidatus Thermoplasmatota archaeon]